jgi:hypothetical protein
MSLFLAWTREERTCKTRGEREREGEVGKGETQQQPLRHLWEGSLTELSHGRVELL